MAKSAKTEVIEWIFFNLMGYDPTTGQLDRDVVNFQDVTEGIRTTGAELRMNNPANFWKDLTRGPNAEANWPSSVREARYTGADAIGAGDQACFRFVSLPPGQTTAFLERLVPTDELIQAAHSIQSLSMPLATKALGRTDENWLAQVGSRLGVVETHFAIFSTRSVSEVSFLQTGVKMREGEVDVAYRLLDDLGKTWLLAAEAKGRRERIHEPQVLRAAVQLARTDAAQGTAGVIPFAIKIIGRSLLQTVEFEPVGPESQELIVAAQGAVRLIPPVRGIE